ncbi:MAG TPA: bifunctional riboflavin kinase/FAD synthetase [Terrimesophilobacter sp.]|nr:bifunctional riboflavin kinase/FAD synthetase [Terrimesophilobacter sp.]
MKLFTSLEELPTNPSGSAVTIGKFDGMHLGHRRMVELVNEVAAERGLVSTVLTFDRHPFALLRPEACPLALVSNEQKLGLLSEAGVDRTVMLEFTREFSQQAPDDFVLSVLVEAIATRVLVVGVDYRFGAGAKGTVTDLERLGAVHGFDVVVVDPVAVDSAERVSSTRIRALLDEGEVREAAVLLGRLASVRGVVVHGAKRGHALGFPTANLSPEHEGFIPADGVYAGWVLVGGERMPAAISVGNNPTFEGVPQKQVEAHVLDRELDLYDKTVEVQFADRVRGMEKFDSLDELTAAIARDVARVRVLLGL